MKLGVLLAVVSLHQACAVSPGIAVRNYTTTISDDQLQSIVGEIQIQIDRDFYPIWLTRADLHFVASDADVGTMWKVSVVDSVPGALQESEHGYDVTAGKPYATVYTTVQRPLSVGMSHEILEMLANPWLGRVSLVADSSPGVLFDVVYTEVCDPVAWYTYPIDPTYGDFTQVTDFVMPAWFSQALPASQLDPVPIPKKWSFAGSLFGPMTATGQGTFAKVSVTATR